jgi:hypothetical protein
MMIMIDSNGCRHVRLGSLIVAIISKILVRFLFLCKNGAGMLLINSPFFRGFLEQEQHTFFILNPQSSPADTKKNQKSYCFQKKKPFKSRVLVRRP